MLRRIIMLGVFLLAHFGGKLTSSNWDQALLILLLKGV